MIIINKEIVCNSKFDIEAGFCIYIHYHSKKAFNFKLFDNNGRELVRDLEYTFNSKKGKVKFLRCLKAEEEYPIIASYCILQGEEAAYTREQAEELMLVAENAL